MSIKAPGQEKRETDNSVSVGIVQEVAAQTGTDPMDLPPLADSIDTDALDSLFASTRSADRQSGQIEFQYYGHHITVSFDGSRSITVI
jgi:hypothetical protein